MLIIELNDIVEALQELDEEVNIIHNNQLIMTINWQTNIKPFRIKKDAKNGLIILDFNWNQKCIIDNLDKQ